MSYEMLLDYTKTILKYLIKNGPDYQTVFSLNIHFYDYCGQHIPYYAFGYDDLYTFLQNIPDTLQVDSFQRIRPSLQWHHVTQRHYGTTLPYQPKVLQWTRAFHNRREPKERSFRPIPIKKPDSIGQTPLQLGPRSYGDGKCSSPDSIKNVNELEGKTVADNQLTLSNEFLSVSTNLEKQKMFEIDKNNNTAIGYPYSVRTGSVEDEDASDKNNDTSFDYQPSLQTESVKDKNDIDRKNNELDLSVASISISKKTSFLSAISECKHDDSSSAIIKFDDDSAPPPYKEEDDLVFYQRDSYDYDLHYYLSSPEDKASQPLDESLSNSAIPFMFTEDDDPIHMLDSGFYKSEYGSKYKTTAIDSVMKVEGMYELYISEVNNPYKFWFQFDDETSVEEFKVEELQEHLNMHYNMYSFNSSSDLIKKEHIIKGYACAALYDNVWHRGEILGHPKDKYVDIFFVDFGTVDIVRISDIRYLLRSFCDVPKLCYRGTLDFVKPIGHRWDVSIAGFFIRLIQNKKLIAGVSEIDIKTNSVRLYVIDKENNVNINFELVRNGLAFPEDPREGALPAPHCRCSTII